MQTLNLGFETGYREREVDGPGTVDDVRSLLFQSFKSG